jgi:hypothetical protein
MGFESDTGGMDQRICNSAPKSRHGRSRHGSLLALATEVGEVWAHHVHLDQDGFRSLTPGESVALGYIDMSPGTQDGFRYRAAWVRRVAPRAP